jgi:hypothetical protein
MSWIDQVPLDYSEKNTRTLLTLLKRVYRSPGPLNQIAVMAGIDVAHINFGQPPALLPLEILDQAANEVKMVNLLAEVLVDGSARAIRDNLLSLLDQRDAQRVYARAIEVEPSFDRISAFPPAVEYEVNNLSGDLQKIVNANAKFDDPAVFRHKQAEVEARVLRMEIDGLGVGTGWLAAPDLVLTAYHVIAAAVGKWSSLSARLDMKIVPSHDNLVLSRGRVIRFTANPLLASSRDAGREIEFSEKGSEPSLLDYALLQLAEPVGKQGLAPDGTGEIERGWFTLPVVSHTFDQQEGLLILGHPMLKGDSEAGPLKLSYSLPAMARPLANGCRVRYGVNTMSGNSGSPVMDQEFRPLLLHHGGTVGAVSWDRDGLWPHGFNQGVPLALIAADITGKVKPDVVSALGQRHE